MTITLYGIKNCNSVKKATTKLEELDVSYDFHDYKKQGIDRDSLERWVKKLGIDIVLNKRGTTWRKLNDEQKQNADADVENSIALTLDNTSMIKRPIIEGEYLEKAVLICGFDEEAMVLAFEK